MASRELLFTAGGGGRGLLLFAEPRLSGYGVSAVTAYRQLPLGMWDSQDQESNLSPAMAGSSPSTFVHQGSPFRDNFGKKNHPMAKILPSDSVRHRPK